jgi:hypothetical protein
MNMIVYGYQSTWRRVLIYGKLQTLRITSKRISKRGSMMGARFGRPQTMQCGQQYAIKSCPQ